MLFAGVQPTVTDPWLLSWATGPVVRLHAGDVSRWPSRSSCVAWLVQRYTRLGRYAMAIGGGEEIAAPVRHPRRRRTRPLAFTVAGAVYGLAAVMVTAQLGSGIVQAGAGSDFAAITAAVVGGTQLAGGRGGVLHSMVGVLILTVLANGLVLVGVSPYVQRRGAGRHRRRRGRR